MLLAPRHCSTAADLLRLLACWLALAFVLQGLAAAQALGRGPLHLHRDVPQSRLAAHAHHHDDARHHHHGADDWSVVALDGATDGLDIAAFALTAALALLAFGAAVAAPSLWRHQLRANAQWAWNTTDPTPQHRPPRPA